MPLNHVIKIFGYMYKLARRNIKVYKQPVRIPQSDPILNNSVHWVGHATTVINLEGRVLVTDPVIGNLSFMKRMVKPSVDLTSMKVDYILITHAHMDHLNYGVLNKMDKTSTIIVPRGMKSRLKMLGFKKIKVLVPGESYKDKFLTISALRANHNGSRYMYVGYKGSNSYMIKSKTKSVFFAGDTAYTSAYKGIKADVAIMPVGCYKPDSFMKMHCSPQQSFQMFKMMDCYMMLPVHYKTYILAQDNDEDTEIILNQLNDGSINMIDIGQTISI